jgi:hypothetical protein
MHFKSTTMARNQWLTSVILATQEGDIRRIMVQSQLRQIVCKNQSQKKKKNMKELITKKGLSGDLSIGPQFKP